MKKLTLSDKAGFLTMGAFATQLTALITGIILARFLSKEAFGTYRQVQLVFQIISPIFMVALPDSLLYFLPNLDKRGKKKFISQTILLLAGLGMLMSVLIAASASWVSAMFSNPPIQQLILIYSPFPFIVFTGMFIKGYLVVEEKVRLLTIITFSSALALLTGIVVNASIHSSLEVIILTNMSITALFTAFTLIYTLQTIGIKFSIDKESIKKQLVYAIPLGLTAVVGLVAWQTDRLLVSLFFNPTLYAIYLVGAVEIPFLTRITASISGILIPEMSSLYAKKEYTKIVDIWKSSARKTSLIMFPAFVYFMIFASNLIVLLYTDKYVDSVLYFRIYLLLLPIRIVTYGLIFQAIGKTKFNLYGSLLFWVLNLVISATLIKPFGLAGPAIGTVIATVAFATYYMVNLKWVLKESILNLMPWKQLMVNFAIALVSSIFIIPVLLVDLPNFVSLLAGGVVYLIGYYILLNVFKILTEDDKELIKRWLTLEVLRK